MDHTKTRVRRARGNRRNLEKVNSLKPGRKEQRQIVQTTSIESIFRAEIFMIKLFGGSLFNWPNRLQAIAYKYSFILLKLHAWPIITLPGDEEFESQRDYGYHADLMENFETFHETILTICFIFSQYVEISGFNTVSIVLNKRLDVRYLEQGSPNIRFVKWMFYLWIVLALGVPNELSKWIYAVDNFCFEHNSTDCSVLTYMESVNDSEGSLILFAVRQFPKLVASTLVRAFDRSASALFVYGTLFIYLMITATITDTLAKVSRDLDDGDDEQTNTKSPTAAMLVHVRDVLVAVRQSMGTYYMSTSMILLTVAGLYPTYAFVSAASGHPMIYLEIIQTLLSFIFIFAWISRTECLHQAAEEIAEKSQLKLVNKTSRSRVESTTIVKLADDISEIWPTDWLVSDTKWWISTLASLFVFVVTLFQIADKRGKRASESEV